MMEKSSKVFVAGHRGMVGSAIIRKLKAEGYHHLVVRTSEELDLRNQFEVAKFFTDEQPEYVFMAAARVGGILANNTYRADFLYENLMIESNVIHQSYVHNVKKLLFLGSSCIYPKLALQPLKEEYLLSGFLEETNEPYAIAKIAGIKLCESYRSQYGCNFVSAMPTNLYGPFDNYDLKNSHVIPALIRKFHDAREERKPHVEIWGTGSPLREFLHVDDVAEACLFLMLHYDEGQFINMGSGVEMSIRELAILIKEITGYSGSIQFDPTKPDGTPRKLLDSSRLAAMGWKPRIELRAGIKQLVETLDFNTLRI
jgi:GDP-L-fucose synthase